MSALANVTAAHIGGKNVSLQSLLYAMKITDRLGDIRNAAEDLVIQQAAEREGFLPGDAELQAEADNLRVALGLHLADATHAWLKDRGMNVDDLENYLIRLIAARRLKDKLAGDKIEAFFMEHRPGFDAARLSRLAAGDAAAAKDVAARITAGTASLASLSGQFPADASAAPADGAGFTLRMHMDPAVAAAVFRASPGEVVGPVKTGRGAYEVVQVHEVRRAELDERTAALVRDLVFGAWLRGEVERVGVDFQLPAQITAS